MNARRVSLAWLATSIATLAGALGATLEAREIVREAAYTYQPDTQLTAHRRPARAGTHLLIAIAAGTPSRRSA